MFIMKPELWLCGKALALIQFRWDNVIAERGLVSSGRGGLQLPKIQEQMHLQYRHRQADHKRA